MKKVLQGDVSFYVRNLDLISLRQKYNYKKHEGKHDRNRWTQTSAGRARGDTIPNYRGIYQLGPD
jgi:hypothetical protein